MATQTSKAKRFSPVPSTNQSTKAENSGIFSKSGAGQKMDPPAKGAANANARKVLKQSVKTNVDIAKRQTITINA